MLVGLSFYVTMTFILDVNIHFVHVWGIEFLLNMVTMFVVSWFYPARERFEVRDLGVVTMTQWKYAKPLASVLVVLTVGIYILLGR